MHFCGNQISFSYFSEEGKCSFSIVNSFRFKEGIDFSGQEEIIKKAFSIKKSLVVAISINSPGGSPVQSHLLYKFIREQAKKHKKKVIVFTEDVAASGGYWLACSADEIFASKASIIGSIGVVSSGFGFDKAIQKLGVERRLYTSGDNKAILDPFLPENKEIFTGAFWSGEKSLELGLIDSFGEMIAVLKDRFGENVKIKEFAPKKKLFGFGSLLSGALDMLIYKVEERSAFNKFGL